MQAQVGLTINLVCAHRTGRWYNLGCSCSYPGAAHKGGAAKILLDYRTKVANWLVAAADSLRPRPNNSSNVPKFVDLAPTDQADPAGVYSAALASATSNPRVMNIALTGPYGSGKSSIIKSFLRGYKRPVLQISLAAFLPGSTPASAGASRQEIERSILQQMLYGADANRLPLSRFKRIHSPGRWSFFASLFMVLGLIACWHLIKSREEILTGTYFNPWDITNWFNLVTFVIGGGFVWAVLHHIYVSSFGISLKSISLKDIELAPQAATEESILNRHLDEIIYFFQSTKYDLVVIEDLDRFNDHEIFVTLREINSLVNANASVKRHVRFLYALRDDMFVNTDRTKFFEFLIPVIPIINSSNSIDKVLEQGQRLSLDSRLDAQFLREVSRYLNDLRLIQNIFNEYAIYSANLEMDEENNLDANKLLAVLIYKNVFPSDFENLHRSKGHLADVFQSHDRLVAASEARFAAEIAHLESLVALGERQLPADVEELRRIYAMALIECIPEQYTRVSLDRSHSIPLSELAQSERFEEFIKAEHIYGHPQNGGHARVSLADFHAKAEPATFQERRKDVERKSAAFRESASAKIRDLRSRLAGVRMMKFNEIFRDNFDELDKLFEGFGESASLARFLVLEGHLDDTYYQYTSLFHSGRLSPSDNKFLIRIRGFNNPEPDFQIDNPKEVIAAMRDEDFGRHYVLNVAIVDCILSDSVSFASQTARLLDFIASKFDDCEAFFTTYYARGVTVATLITSLARTWPLFVEAVVTSPGRLTHIARILSHLPATDLQELAAANPALTKFVSEWLPDILALGIDFPPERLKLISAEVVDLGALEPYPAFLDLLFANGLYKLSIENLAFVFDNVLRLEAGTRSREQNYTLVLEAGNAPLLAKVNSQFSEYLEAVLLRLPENRLESVSAILNVLNRDDISPESALSFLNEQAALLPSLNQVPSHFHAALFENERIEPTWENCLSFLSSDSYDAEILTDFLNLDSTKAALAGFMIPEGERASPLRKFIIENDALDDEAYGAYIRALPKPHKSFPEDVAPKKTELLVRANRVEFSPENFTRLGDNVSLKVTFVVSNIDKFLQVQDECGVDDDFREKLLDGDLTVDDQLHIVRSMDLSLLAGIPSRAAIVGRVLARTGVKVDSMGAEPARAVILSSKTLEDQIALFNMFQEMFDDQEVREILQSLPKPLPDLKPGWTTPRMSSSEVNLRFVEWLKARGFISSWKQGGFFDDDIRINLFRK